MNTKKVGEIVRKRRKELDLTQSYLAAICGTGVRFISDLENGKTTLQLGLTLKVLEVLGLKVEIITKND